MRDRILRIDEMKHHARLLMTMLTLFAALRAPVFAQNTTRPQAGTRPRYLTAAETPDIGKILEPAPVDGDARDIADRATFRATRSLQGSPRWTLAANDNDISQAGLLRAFRCATDLDLSAQTAPLTATLLSRVSSES